MCKVDTLDFREACLDRPRASPRAVVGDAANPPIFSSFGGSSASNATKSAFDRDCLGATTRSGFRRAAAAAAAETVSASSRQGAGRSTPAGGIALY